MWALILTDVALGALAGGLGWLIVRKRGGADAKANRLVAPLAAALGVAAGMIAVAPLVRARQARRALRETGLALYGNARVADRFAEVMAPIMTRPDLEGRLAPSRHAGGSPTGFAELVHAGTARLDAPELDALFAAKRAIAAASPEMCAGFWTGAFSSGSLNEALRHLDERAQLAWITVSTRAATLELAASSPEPRLPLLTVTRAMMRLREAMPPDDQAAFERATGAELAAAPDACRAFQALSVAVDKLPADLRETIIRATSNPEVVDSSVDSSVDGAVAP